jgi:hypothetical protein
VFRLVGRLEPEGTRYYLTVPRGAVGNYRLAVVSAEGKVRVISLEELHGARAPAVGGGTTVPPPMEPAARLSTAAYTAVRRDNQVTLRALGEHPTAGYRVAFERVPGNAEPPEFRLVEQPPVGNPKRERTTFDVQVTFESSRPPRYVRVTDVKGRHRVPVQLARKPR